MTLQVCIQTPDRIFFNESADEIVLPTATGQMGVLTNHTPLMTALDIGVMLIRNNKKWTGIALLGGFALIKTNTVTVLVNEAEAATDIDPSAVETEYTTAQEKWQTASQSTNQKQKVEANFALKRAKARYQLIGANKET